MNKRQKKKQTQKRNKALVERYPFLLPRNVWTDEVVESYNYSWTLFDEIPKGWRDCFGIQLCEDLRAALVKINKLYTFRFDQIKEKYGSLRLYSNWVTDEISEILMKYEHLSEHVCIQCGKVNVPMVYDSWISPYCKNCFDRFLERYNSNKKYEDFVHEDEWTPEMPLDMTFKIRRFSKEKTEDIEYSIEDIVRRIPNRYLPKELKRPN